MKTLNRIFLAVLAAGATTFAAAAEQKPAWQEPGFVMEEIVVTLPRTRIEHDYVAEIVVTLSLAEQAKIRQTSADEAVELAAQRTDTPTRL
jgi:hypothetical protein